jgi:hypothetical protein
MFYFLVATLTYVNMNIRTVSCADMCSRQHSPHNDIHLESVHLGPTCNAGHKTVPPRDETTGAIVIHCRQSCVSIGGACYGACWSCVLAVRVGGAC